ncbi:MAG: deoxyribose-phosphate aldolase [Candidatus Aerophobetes bacterium]|nr:deoxyribose-phosphate aldolase [Candidatus Aerophobetes bacterium]
MKKNELARKLVTSIIETDVTEDAVRKFIKKAKEYPFRAIAVDLPYLEITKELLQGTDTRVSAVASYPLGGMTTETKISQVEYAIDKKADEVDVSMNYNAIKSGDFATVLDDVKRVAEAAGDRIEVIMIPQTHILTIEEKIKVYSAILEGGVKAVKINSGFGWNTKPEDVILIKREFGNKFLRIDVSGGVRTTEQALEFLKLGADYIHTSTPDQVLEKAE